MEVNKTLAIKLTKEESTTLREAFSILDDIANELQDANVDYFNFMHGDVSAKLDCKMRAEYIYKAHECLDIIL